jgi:hypothetical protein
MEFTPLAKHQEFTLDISFHLLPKFCKNLISHDTYTSTKHYKRSPLLNLTTNINNMNLLAPTHAHHSMKMG